MAFRPVPAQRLTRHEQRDSNHLTSVVPQHGAGTMVRTLPTGTIIETHRPRIRLPGSDHPWKITLGTETPWTVKLTPGVIYLTDEVKPKVNNQEMDADPRPEIAIGVGTYYIAVGLRVEPVIGFQTIDDVNIYYLTHCVQKEGTQSTITAIKEDQWPPAADKLAAIDYRTGVVTPGDYYIGLGKVKRTSGNEASLTVLEQKWKNDIAFTMQGDGSMFLGIR